MKKLVIFILCCMITGCAIQDTQNEKPTRTDNLRIVGVDEEHGVVCYSHGHNAIGISCVKVK